MLVGGGITCLFGGGGWGGGGGVGVVPNSHSSIELSGIFFGPGNVIQTPPQNVPPLTSIALPPFFFSSARAFFHCVCAHYCIDAIRRSRDPPVIRYVPPSWAPEALPPHPVALRFPLSPGRSTRFGISWGTPSKGVLPCFSSDVVSQNRPLLPRPAVSTERKMVTFCAAGHS